MYLIRYNPSNGISKKELRLYETAAHRYPFEEWLEHLKDKQARYIIRARLDRLAYGNAGKCESVGNSVYELKIYYGPGYRIYFGIEEKTIVILLCGGDKSTQKKDILKAYGYWMDYKRRIKK